MNREKYKNIESLLKTHLDSIHSSFGMGSFGAIAEFQRNSTEKTEIDLENSKTIITTRGAIRVELNENALALAYENLNKNPTLWRNGIVFCLPKNVGKSRQRSVLTELGPDWSAIRSKDRSSVLFDIGICATNVDFCIRTEDEQLIEALRGAEGHCIFEPGNSVMEKIITASPHRIAISNLGRIEVYQRIPTDQTPEGPHTHVLPKLLRTGRTHSVNVPVPEGYLPCLSCYPSNPMYDILGNETPFDQKKFWDFMKTLEKWGLPDYLDEKKRVLDAIQHSVAPKDFAQPSTRLGRTALRVTLRQLICQNQNSSLLRKWQQTFDSIDNNGTI